MNKLTIIGNLTKDPDLRTTANGVSVCAFDVAVNRRRKVEGQPDADFFHVTVWRERGEVCAAYLQKGRKVCVVGPVSVTTYTGNDGVTRARMEVQGDEVEFLSQKDKNAEESGSVYVKAIHAQKDAQAGFTAVETDELPF